MIGRAIRNRVNPPPCESRDGCPYCAYAFHCHERRVGFTNRIFWPGVALGIMVVLALPAMLF